MVFVEVKSLASAVAMEPLLSLEPSSIMIISFRSSSCATRLTTCSRVRSSLNTGMSTERKGSSIGVGPRGVLAASGGTDVMDETVSVVGVLGVAPRTQSDLEGSLVRGADERVTSMRTQPRVGASESESSSNPNGEMLPAEARRVSGSRAIGSKRSDCHRRVTATTDELPRPAQPLHSLARCGRHPPKLR